MAFTMAYPNFKKGLKMAFGPLGVKPQNFIIFFLDYLFLFFQSLILATKIVFVAFVLNQQNKTY
jgi:hypothetical protein